MSMPFISQVFEPGLPRMPVDSIIQEHIQATLQDMSRDLNNLAGGEPKNPGGALADLGDYFTRTAAFWSKLTTKIVNGSDIESIIRKLNTEVHEAIDRQTYMADLSCSVAVDLQISRLRQMKDLSQKYCQEMQAIWHPKPGVDARLYLSQPPALSQSFDEKPLIAAPSSAPLEVKQEPPGLDAGRIRDVDPQHMMSPSLGSSSGSGDSSDDDERFSRVNMDALKQRGKGEYYCPKGMKCDKGGVDPNGNLVQFDRNSSFAQHCNKHRKPWRCDLPGCPNPPKKRKFARRDGLERHKHTVKHHVTA